MASHRSLTREIRSKIRGVTYPESNTGINRQKLIKKHVRKGIFLQPVPEPNNPVDSYAVGLWIRGGCLLFRRRYHIGYLSKTHAIRVAYLLDQKKPVEIQVSSVTGGTRKKRTRGVNIVIRY